MEPHERKTLEALRRKRIHQAKLIAERYLRHEQEHLARSTKKIKDIEIDMQNTKHRIKSLSSDIEGIFSEIDDITRRLGD